jgi:hypothetical protein
VAQAQTPPAATTPPAQAAAPPPPPSLVVGGVDVGKQVNDSLNSLRSILEGITDVASAQAASRQLQNVIAQIERFDVLFPQLTVEQRTAFAGIVNAQMATINQLFDKVLAIPNVAQVLTPTIASLKLKLAVIQAAPSVIVGGVDIGKQVSDTLAQLRSILEGIINRSAIRLPSCAQSLRASQMSPPRRRRFRSFRSSLRRSRSSTFCFCNCRQISGR